MRTKVPTLKLPKGVDQTYIDNMQSMSTDQLKAEIVRLQVAAEENDAFKESEGYVKAKEQFEQDKAKFDLVAGPVKETAVSIRNKTKLIVERLKEKGGA